MVMVMVKMMMNRVICEVIGMRSLGREEDSGGEIERGGDGRPPWEWW